MKRTIFFWFCLSASLFAGQPWPGVEYAEVRAFAWKIEWPKDPHTDLAMVYEDFWMVSMGGALAGASLPVPTEPPDVLREWVFKAIHPEPPFPWEWRVRPDMSFAPGIINGNGTRLSKRQVQVVLKAEARRRKPRGVAGCYNPHNAFVFYDANQKPVAFLEVCFDCMGSRTGPEDEQCDPDFFALAKLCADLKLPFGMRNSVEQVKKDMEMFDPPMPTKRHR